MKTWTPAIVLFVVCIIFILSTDRHVVASYSNGSWLCPSGASAGTTFTCTATYLDGSAVSSALLASPPNAQEVVLVPDVDNLATDTLTVNAGGNTFGLWRNNTSSVVREFAGGEMGANSRQTFRFTTSSSKWMWQSGQNAQGIAPVTATYSVGLLRVALPYNGQTLFGGVTPSLGSCGIGPTLAAGAVNNAGTINVGTGLTTSCVLNFSSVFTNAPSCAASDNNAAISTGVSSVAVGSVTFSFSASLGGGQLYYHCF